MQLCTEPPSSEGALDGVQGFQAACLPQDTMGATAIKHYMFRRGMCVEVRAFAMDPMQVFPAGRAVSTEGGVAVHRGDAK